VAGIVNASARRRALAGIVQQRGSVTVSELAGEFGCSEMTIRRDLDALGHDGTVRRRHGPALTASLRADEKPYPVRAFEASDAKERIGVVTFGHVCPLSAAERLVTDAPQDDTADLEALGFIVQRA
jgi:DeoR/GlpR family transcriptional regulator of sugar metabolism